MDDAMEWAMRMPDPSPGEEVDVEIRPFFSMEDFGEEFTPELQERVDEMHRHEAARQKAASGARTLASESRASR